MSKAASPAISPAQSPKPRSPAEQDKSKTKSKGNIQAPKVSFTLDVSVHFSPQQVHDLFERFDATNRNGLYALFPSHG
jgi:hypothetical protein